MLFNDHSDFDTLHLDVCFQSFLDPGQGVVMGNEFFHGQTDTFGALEERERRGIILGRIDPGTDQSDFLVADIVVVVDGTFAAVHEETDFAHTAAATDHLPCVLCGSSHAGALDEEFSAETIGNGFDVSELIIEALVVHEVEGMGRAEAFGKFQTVVIAVHCDDIFDTECTENSHDHQTDGTAALNENFGIETEQTGQFGAFHSVDRNSCGFNEHTLIEGHTVDFEHGGVFADHDIRRNSR